MLKGAMFLLGGVMILSSCRKRDDVPLPDNLVQFEAAQQGIGSTETSKTIKVKLSRATTADIALTIGVTASSGIDTTDYKTLPASAATGTVALTILSGNSEASFTVNKTSNATFFADDKLVFTILTSASPVIIGSVKEFTLNFTEIISNGTSLTGDGGGLTYGNKVFFDLSANSQTSVQRTKWDLGFYSGSDDFRVILNSSTAMMAKQIAKNDLAAVTAADTLGFGADVVFNQNTPTTTSLAYVDYPTGDLTRTAIASVAANAADNKVYIINRGTGIGSPAPARGWKKVRIIRNSTGGYTVQHADIASTTFTSVDIPKNATFFFNYVSFENGPLNVEPAAKKWDLAWTYFTNVTNFGAGEVPYNFQDFIVQNRNVQIDTIRTSVKSYADFKESDLGLVNSWVGSQVGIGADWRAGGGPTTSPSVRTDRYYIIKDGDNNIYKLRFTSLTHSQSNERGYPTFEFALVKKGS